MEKEQIRALLSYGKKMKLVMKKISRIIVVFMCFLVFLIIFLAKNQNYYVNYDEIANADYKVYLKKNDFFETNYLDSNNQYIATLIDHVQANFDYELTMEEEDVDYVYSYRIDANVDVREKDNNNSLYNFTDEMVKECQNSVNDSSNVKINKTVDIDYNHYNDIVKKFINSYALENVTATLTIKMYVTVNGSCEDFENNSNNESAIQISIPLNTKTVDVEVCSDFTDAKENSIICKKINNKDYVFLILSILFAIIDITLIVKLIIYGIKNATAESIYEKELRKILNNYGSYIQKINNEIDMSKYDVLDTATFNDILEIRETLKAPILMTENIEKKETYFTIIGTMNIIYVYKLTVSDIKMKKKLFAN